MALRIARPEGVSPQASQLRRAIHPSDVMMIIMVITRNGRVVLNRSYLVSPGDTAVHRVSRQKIGSIDEPKR